VRHLLFIALLFLAGLSFSEALKSNASQSLPTQKLQLMTPPLTAAGSRMPRLVKLPNADVLMSWVEPRGKGHVLKFSVLHEGRWLKPGEVIEGENWFVNWADYPSVVAIDEKFWVAHWLVKQKGAKTYDYDIALAISNDAGLSWRNVGHPHQDKGVAAEHGFVTIFPDAEEAGIVWLDGRNYLKKEDKAQGLNNSKSLEKSGNFNLRYTRVHHDGTIEAEHVLDDNTCTCCWTSVATTRQGALAAWRGRTDDEIRDNRVALLRNGKWSAPKGLGSEGWRIAGCPVNGPSVAAHDNQVATAWFTAEGERPRVRLAFSMDGGEVFAKPIEIDDATPLGRVGLVWKDSRTVVVSWMTASDPVTKKSNLALRTVGIDGKIGAVTRVVEFSAGRDTGVPQIAAIDQGVVLAWTDSAPNYGLRTALVDWQRFESERFQSAGTLKPTVFTNKTEAFVAAICGRSH